jgi:hypothetical protein
MNPMNARVLALVLLLCTGNAFATDTYSGGQLSVPSIAIGRAIYFNVVVTVERIVSGPTGATGNGSEDSYDPGTNQLTIPNVIVGAITYHNVVITVGTLVSIGSVVGVDTYSAPALSIPTVQILGGPAYSNVVITVGSIISAGGGMPTAIQDLYDPATKRLTVAAIQLGSKVYTNAIVSVGAVDSVGANAGTLNGAYGMVSYYFTDSVTQPATPSAGSPQAKPLGFSSNNDVVTFDGAGHYTAVGTANTDGTGNTGNVSGTYSVNANGSFTLTTNGSTDVDGGYILAGGSVLNFSKNPGEVPSVGVALKTGTSGFNNASLNGSYGMVSYYFTDSVTQPATPSAGSPQAIPLGFSSSNDMVAFDGAGHYTAVGTTNTDGTGSAGNVSGTYSVNSDGSFTLTTSGSTDVLAGYILAGGSVLNFSKNPGEVPSMGVALKTGTWGFTNASLKGSYGMVSYYFTDSVTQPATPSAGLPQAIPLGFSSNNDVVTFDGAGHYMAVGTANTDGTGNTGNVSGTYNVNLDGSFTLTANGSSDVDGGYILAGGGMFSFSKSPGEVPSIGIGIAQ